MKVIVFPKIEDKDRIDTRVISNKQGKEASSSTKLLSQAFKALKDIERNNVLKSAH